MVGEHIRALKDGRWNHAIDCGDETVIHLAEDETPAPRVRRSYRPQFVGGAEVVEVVTHRERTFAANEIVARAYSRISDAGLSASFRDSEAFAEWCVTGRAPAAAARAAVSAAEEAKAAAGRATVARPARKKKARPAAGARKAAPARGAKARASASRRRGAAKPSRPASRKRAPRGR